MPIEFDPDVIERFFGVEVEMHDPTRHSISATIEYTGCVLKYCVMFCDRDVMVSISGDPETPFGADSFYEINIPCDSITESEDGYYPGKTGLNFWYGNRACPHNLMMMLLKSPSGDLKVWPACPWPARHPMYKMLEANAESEPYT